MALSDSTVAFVQLQKLRCDALSSQTFFFEAQNANFKYNAQGSVVQTHTKLDPKAIFLGGTDTIIAL